MERTKPAGWTGGEEVERWVGRWEVRSLLEKMEQKLSLETWLWLSLLRKHRKGPQA